MTKRVVAVVLAVLMILFTFVGCGGYNKQIFDFNRKYNTAIIGLPDGTSITVKVKKWNDYEGEQLQIIDENGTVYLVSSFNCILINE